MDKKWNYVAKDGNPTKEGKYWVTLIHPEMRKVGENKWEPTGTMLAIVEQRWFGDASLCPDWIMSDQPKEGLVWTEECGSWQDESVYAWMEIEDVPMADLPEGVIPTIVNEERLGITD